MADVLSVQSSEGQDIDSLPPRSKANVLISYVRSISVEPIMFLYMICLYYLIPAANSLYLYKVCRTQEEYEEFICESLVRANFTNMTEEEHIVSEETASWMFYQTIVFTIPSMIVTLLMGLYGDRYGRRIPLISPLFGQLIGCSYYLIMSFYETLHVKYMLFGACITGLSGGFACIIMASMSHISATSNRRERTVRLVVLQGIMGCGTVLGSFTVGSINKTGQDPRIGWITTFAAIMVLMVIAIIYSVIRFRNYQHPEGSYFSINSERRLERLTDYCSSFNPAKICSTICADFPSVLQLVFVAIWLAWVTGLGEFDVLYSYAQRMKLDLAIYGYYNGYSAGVQAVAGIISVLVFKGMFHLSDAVISLIGLTSASLELLLLGISGFVGDGTSKVFLAFWWTAPCAGMFKITGPSSLRSIASGLVTVNNQAKLFAFISATDAILQLATAALYNDVLWPYTEKSIPSLSFFISLSLVTLSIICTVVIYFLLRRRRSSSFDSSQESLIIH